MPFLRYFLLALSAFGLVVHGDQLTIPELVKLHSPEPVAISRVRELVAVSLEEVVPGCVPSLVEKGKWRNLLLT